MCLSLTCTVLQIPGAQDLVDFSPVYRCLHIYTVLVSMSCLWSVLFQVWFVWCFFFFQNMISVLALTLTHITCILFPKAPCCAMCGSQRKYLVCFQNMFMKMWIFVNECIFLVCVWEVVKCVICVNVTVLWVFYITIQVWGQSFFWYRILESSKDALHLSKVTVKIILFCYKIYLYCLLLF